MQQIYEIMATPTGKNKYNNKFQLQITFCDRHFVRLFDVLYVLYERPYFNKYILLPQLPHLDVQVVLYPYLYLYNI